MAVDYPLILEPGDGKLCFRNDGNYLFARDRAAVPIGLHEVQNMVAVAPLALVKREDGWRLVAGTALQGTGNLLVGPQGGWLGAHIPERLALFPLVLASDPVSGDLRLAKMAESPRLDSGATGALFDEYGEPSPLYQGHLQVLARHAKSDQRVAEIAQLMLQHKMLQELPRQPQENAVTYGVSAEGLHEVAADELKTLLDAGAVALFYALMYARMNAHKFLKLKQRQPGQGPAAPAADSFLPADEPTGFNFDI